MCPLKKFKLTGYCYGPREEAAKLPSKQQTGPMHQIVTVNEDTLMAMIDSMLLHRLKNTMLF